MILNLALSHRNDFKCTAFCSLKDFVMLNYNNLIDNFNDVIQAFLYGSIQDDEMIQTECANALSYLVMTQLVYSNEDGLYKNQEKLLEKLEQIEFESSNHVLDGIMILSCS
jgi:hypothetical protein